MEIIMFIRARDTVKMIQDSKEISFLNSNRKGNIIKKFRLVNNDVEFFDDELINKMIPKKELPLFDTKDIKILITSNNDMLAFQDFKDAFCKFLTYNEGSDDIILIDFDEIIPDETEILCYYPEIDDYFFAKVSVILSLQFEPMIEGEEDMQIEENNKNFKRELQTLSNYVLYSDPHTGVILNNILVM
jgi:hypothetical protein